MNMKLCAAYVSVSMLLSTPALYSCGACNGSVVGAALAEALMPRKSYVVIGAISVAAAGFVAYYMYTKYSKEQQQKKTYNKKNA